MVSSSPRTRLSPEQRRDDILASAVTRALDIGIEQITVRDVADFAGVATGLVHHYFGSVQTLVAEVFESVVREDLERIHPYGPDEAPMMKLKQFFDRSTSPERSPVLRMWLGAWVAANKNEALSAAVFSSMQAGHQLLLRLVQDGSSSGEFRTEDPEASTWRILVTYDGLAVERTLNAPVFGHGKVQTIVAEVIEAELGIEGLLKGK